MSWEMSASPHQNLLHLLCSCSSELYHHPLGHLSRRTQGHSTLPHALLHQLSPLPVGHSPSPVSCLLSQTLYSDILMTGLSATRFPLVQCFHIAARDTALKNRCDIPYRAKPKLLTLALPLRHSPARPQTTLEPYLLPLLHWISPLCEHWALSQLHGSTEKEMDTIQKGIQNTQVDGTTQSPLHSLFCLRYSVPSLPGTGYRICDAIPNFPRQFGLCFIFRAASSLFVILGQHLPHYVLSYFSYMFRLLKDRGAHSSFRCLVCDLASGT